MVGWGFRACVLRRRVDTVGCWVRGLFRVDRFMPLGVLTLRQDGHKCASLERRSDSSSEIGSTCHYSGWG